MNARANHATSRHGRARGSVLIIVMWISLGLVTLTLYFANSMSSELRAAGNRTSETAARQAIAGATRYAAYILKTHATGGNVPEIEDYQAEEVLVGDATFWFIGRNTREEAQRFLNEPYFALVDENSKLNLNTVTAAMLQALPLPDMTPEFAQAIVAWRSATGQAANSLDAIYAQLDPPRHNKGAPYETVDELRLIDGAVLDMILGEDTNRNGVLDPQEDDGEGSAPRDDQNGQLLAGLLEYVTVYSRQPATSAEGAQRINVTTINTQAGRQQLQTRLTDKGVTAERVAQIMALFPFNPNNPQNPAPTSVADFMVTSQMTADEFALVRTDLSHANGVAQGLVNVNTAGVGVLSAIPGIGPDRAPALVSYRQANKAALTSMAWLAQVLTPAQIRQAGTFITDQSYQFSADIAAVGANGRGYSRERVIFDMSTATPRIIFRQDMTAAGWALGQETRRILNGTNDT